MMKEGYFVIVHDIDSVVICFVPDSPEAVQLFKDFNTNMYNDDKIQDLWNDFNEYHDNGTIEAWASGKWIFNGYIIKEAFSVFQY